MKNYRERIPFGQECRLNLGFGSTCPVCDVQRGSNHEYGCQAEECPKCHGPLLGCFCECLHPAEEILIVRAIEASFTSQDEASKAGAGVGNRKVDAMTLIDKGAVSYFINNCSPEVKAKVDKGFRELFPGLEPCGTNGQGQRVFDIKDIAKALGADEDELKEVAQALVSDDSSGMPVSPSSIFH